MISKDTCSYVCIVGSTIPAFQEFIIKVECLPEPVGNVVKHVGVAGWVKWFGTMGGLPRLWVDLDGWVCWETHTHTHIQVTTPINSRLLRSLGIQHYLAILCMSLLSFPSHWSRRLFQTSSLLQFFGPAATDHTPSGRFCLPLASQRKTELSEKFSPELLTSPSGWLVPVGI